eukprot:scaffold16581_cov24-Tisochrysis_lutea.AAC.4
MQRQRACQAKAMEGWQGILCDARAARAKLRRAQRRRDTRLQVSTHAHICKRAQQMAMLQRALHRRNTQL